MAREYVDVEFKVEVDHRNENSNKPPTFRQPCDGRNGTVNPRRAMYRKHKLRKVHGQSLVHVDHLLVVTIQSVINRKNPFHDPNGKSTLRLVIVLVQRSAVPVKEH